MNRCLIYARVSTKDQSTKNQIIPMQEYARQRGWQVVEVVEDQGISGTTNKRPGLEKLMGMAHRREFDILLVYGLDRFGRSIKDLVSALEELKTRNIDFCSYSQQAMDTTTPAGKMLFSITSAFAEFEAGIIKERVKAGLERARAEGTLLGRRKKLIPGPMVQRILSLRKKKTPLLTISKKVGIPYGTLYRIIQNPPLIS